MQIWGATDRGMVRKQNQDFFRYKQMTPRAYLAVVCDGMGGSRSGDVAARLASEVFLQDVERSVQPEMEQSQIVSMLVSAVKTANKAVYEQSQVSTDFSGMGTTLVSAFLYKADAYIVNVGDSRCYYVARDEIS